MTEEKPKQEMEAGQSEEIAPAVGTAAAENAPAVGTAAAENAPAVGTAAAENAPAVGTAAAENAPAVGTAAAENAPAVGTAAAENAPAVGTAAAEQPAPALEEPAGQGTGGELPPGSEPPADEGNMSLVGHLEELRKRIIRSLIAIGIGSCICYFFIEEIMHYLTIPAGKLYYMQPAEAFFTYLKVAIFGGFLLAVPVVFYHFWRFLLPALTNRERSTLGIVLPASVLLFFAGIAFSFAFVLPAGVKFFIGFGTDELQPLFSIDKYLDFVIAFVLPFGVIFELPLVIVILAKLGFVTSAFLRKKRRIVIFLTFVIGAVISPTPDVFSQSMIAIPMILLYEISLFIVRYILRK